MEKKKMEGKGRKNSDIKSNHGRGVKVEREKQRKVRNGEMVVMAKKLKKIRK